MCSHVLTLACNLTSISFVFGSSNSSPPILYKEVLGSHFVRLFWVYICCQICAIHTPCQNLSRFRALIFNSSPTKRSWPDLSYFPTYHAPTRLPHLLGGPLSTYNSLSFRKQPKNRKKEEFNVIREEDVNLEGGKTTIVAQMWWWQGLYTRLPNFHDIRESPK